MSADHSIARAVAESARAMNEPDTLDGALDAIVNAARASVPGFDGVSISVLRRDGSMETVAGSDQLPWMLDDIQYELQQGPCVDSLRGQPVVFAEHLRHRQEWPEYVPRAVEHGVRAQLGLQLHVGGEVLGGLNLYSTTQEVIEPDAREVAEPFAIHATLALARAQKIDQLQAAIESRQVVGQAVGMLMERYQLSDERAFQFLVRASSTGGLKLRDIAQEMVDDANRRAQDGH